MFRFFLQSIVSLGCLFLFGCTSRVSSVALIRMIDAQGAFFSAEIATPFDHQQGGHLQTVDYKGLDSLEPFLDRYRNRALVVKVPFDRMWDLVDKGRILPINSILGAHDLDSLRHEYVLTGLAVRNNKMWYIPRKFETRVMVYRKSRVADALEAFPGLRDSINIALKEINGLGLPATFTLESDPSRWDWYDLFVVGWIWGHTAYDGFCSGRIAQRGKRYSGTALTLIDRAVQFGADSSALVNLSGDSVAEVFYWEAALAHAGIYNRAMWENGWSGGDIWKAFGNGTVFLSYMTQLDCFFIHGTGRDGLSGL